MLQVIDQIIPITVVLLSQQVQIGQVTRMTTYDEEIVVIYQLLSQQMTQKDNDRAQVGITYRVWENGINC
ncbi:MAG: hypothetical protein LBG59_04555 [Candidatus Peribacteria bacterium]|nr:hypothetical protein [Candidatus Peribacteria bacterium]